MKNEHSTTFFFCLVLSIIIYDTVNADISTERKIVASQSNKLLDGHNTERNENELTKASPKFVSFTEEAIRKLLTVLETIFKDVKQNVEDESSNVSTCHTVSSQSDEITDSQSASALLTLSPLILEKWQNCSCEMEALQFRQKHALKVIIHEIFCEVNKLSQYLFIAGQKLKFELELNLPFDRDEEGKIVISSEKLFDIIEDGLARLDIILGDTENLKILYEIIEKRIPISNIRETLIRLKISIEKFFICIQELPIFREGYIDVKIYINILNELKKEILLVKETALILFNKCLPKYFEEEVKILWKATSLMRLLFHEFSTENYFVQCLEILKQFIGTFSNYYHGHCAFEFLQSVINTARTSISVLIQNFVSDLYKILVKNFDIKCDESFVSIVKSSFFWMFQGISSLACIWLKTNGVPPPLLSEFSPSKVAHTASVDCVVPFSTRSNGNTPFYSSFSFFPSGTTSQSGSSAYVSQCKLSGQSNICVPLLPPIPALPLGTTFQNNLFDWSSEPDASSSIGTTFDTSSLNNIPRYSRLHLNLPSVSTIGKEASLLGLAIPPEDDTSVGNNYDGTSISSSTSPSLRPPQSGSWNSQLGDLSLSDNYLKLLIDSFYKSLHSYLQHNPAITSSNINIFEKMFNFRSSVPSLINSGLCGTATFLSSLSNLNNILFRVVPSQTPLQLPRNEIEYELGNVILSPGDIVVIFPREDIGLVSRVTNIIGPISFNVYKLKPIDIGTPKGVQIWYLRSGDLRNRACKQQLKLLSQAN